MLQEYGIILLLILLWFAPIHDIYKSERVVSAEKYIWIGACIFLSWFSWILFMLFAPVIKRNY